MLGLNLRRAKSNGRQAAIASRDDGHAAGRRIARRHVVGRHVVDRHLVDLRGVVKIYETAAGSFTALKGVDLAVDAGEFRSIIGKSGSGKSTLINVITGIDRPTAGQVLVDHTAVHKLSEGEIAVWRGRTIGVIFRFFQLLPTLTAVENVMLAMDYGSVYPPGERLERAMRLLELVGMADRAHELPSALSGGQQQCVAIARALANDPPLLLADEPTGSLDTVTAGAVLRVFADLVAQGKTIVLVTHDRDIAAQTARTVTLVDGEIVSQASNVVHMERGASAIKHQTSDVEGWRLALHV